MTSIIAEEKREEEQRLMHKFRKLMFPKPPVQPKKAPSRRPPIQLRSKVITTTRKSNVTKRATRSRQPKATFSQGLATQRRVTALYGQTKSLGSSQASRGFCKKLPGQRSAPAIAVLRKVRESHIAGVIQIAPCFRCFNSGKQCVKLTLYRPCSWCSMVRQRCEGAVELGRWVEQGDKRV